MKRIRVVTMACLFAVFWVCSAESAVVDLVEYAFNVDGAISNNSAPGSVNLAAFDTATGLGMITVTMVGTGTHYVGLFVDHEIDAATNTSFNEYGSTSGAPAAGLSWEIDEPGGDIYSNFSAGSLDGTNGVLPSLPDDVSMALGWNFALAADETAIMEFLFNVTAPAGGFYLSQVDPNSEYTLYFNSTLEIQGGEIPVPEPSTMLLLGSGLVGLVGYGRRRFKK